MYVNGQKVSVIFTLIFIVLHYTYTYQGPGMKPQTGSTLPGNHHFFEKIDFWSETRFGPLLMVFERLVVLEMNFEHFFIVGLDYNLIEI